MNTKAEEEEEKDKEAQCDHEPWPENTRQCNLQDCDSASSGERCTVLSASYEIITLNSIHSVNAIRGLFILITVRNVIVFTGTLMK